MGPEPFCPWGFVWVLYAGMSEWNALPMDRESFCPCVLYSGTSGWNALPMGRESLCSCVLFGFCTLGRQGGLFCL